MELVGYEDDETRSQTSFSSWVVHWMIEESYRVRKGREDEESEDDE